MSEIVKRDPEEIAATAWHEAGHVTAYLAKGLSVRYATLRPRGSNALGRTVVRPRMIPGWDVPVIAHAGPLAQGMRAWQTRDVADDDEGIEECDYITSAYLSGGACDLASIAAIPSYTLPDGRDAWEASATELLTMYWPTVTAIAEALLAHQTLKGDALRELALSAGMPEWTIDR